jgi:hypothetical protein
MKKVILFTVVLAVAVFFGTGMAAQDNITGAKVAQGKIKADDTIDKDKWKGYIGFVGGSGGSADATSVGLELGGTTKVKMVNMLFALGYYTTWNRGDKNANNVTYTPTAAFAAAGYTNIGSVHNGEEGGPYAKVGVGLNRNVFLFGQLGVGIAKEDVDLVRDNMGKGIIWRKTSGGSLGRDNKTEYHALYGAGIAYFPDKFPLTFHIGYNNRMGATGMVGFQW